MSFSIPQICGHVVSVRLKTENWRELVQAEMHAASLRSEPLFNPFTNSLLGEDFDAPEMENYDSEGEDDDVTDRDTSPVPGGKGSGTNTPNSGASCWLGIKNNTQTLPRK